MSKKHGQAAPVPVGFDPPGAVARVRLAYETCARELQEMAGVNLRLSAEQAADLRAMVDEVTG